jgi:hypothetical protein
LYFVSNSAILILALLEGIMLTSEQLKMKHVVVLIWVLIGVDVWTGESEACSGVDMGTNWCLSQDWCVICCPECCVVSVAVDKKTEVQVI